MSVLAYRFDKQDPHNEVESRKWQDVQELLHLPSKHLARSTPIRFAVPVPVFSELLVKWPKDQYDTTLNEVTSSFTVLSLDIKSAAIAAGLWQHEDARKTTTSRQCIKFDNLILGVVARHIEVNAFCSYDKEQLKNCAKLERKLDLIGEPHDILAHFAPNRNLPFPPSK